VIGGAQFDTALGQYEAEWRGDTWDVSSKTVSKNGVAVDANNAEFTALGNVLGLAKGQAALPSNQVTETRYCPVQYNHACTSQTGHCCAGGNICCLWRCMSWFWGIAICG
jgi:hypothetical protein